MLNTHIIVILNTNIDRLQEFHMLSLPKKWMITALIALPLPAMASVTTVSFGTIEVGGVTYSSGEPGSNFNAFTVDYGSNSIDVSAWSDTAGNSGTAPNIDPEIERVVDLDRNGNGWAAINVDETPDRHCGYSHSADNFGCDYTDYDFFLLDFGSQQVQLEGVYSSWNYNSDTQVSVAALNPGTGTNLTGLTIDSLLASSQGSGSSTFYSSASVANYYADVDVSATSSLWIVSAYHTMFGTVDGATPNNDGFKLAGVSFTTNNPSTISEPSSFAILALSLIGLVSYRKKTK